jgi:hypothetical protein
MAVHMKKFEDARQKMEERLEAVEAAEGAADARSRIEARTRELEKLRTHKERYEAWMKAGRKDWARNMRTHQANFRRLLQFENCVVERRRRREVAQRREHREQEVEGIGWFEMNMLRLGVASGEQRGAVKEMPTKEASYAFLDRIRAAYVKEEAVRRNEVGAMMAELKEKARAAREAFREKEIRQRKVTRPM